MKFKSFKKKYRCKCKFAWLPVRIYDQYVWLERYYKLQSWDRWKWEAYGIYWSTDYLLTYESYLRNKNNEKFDKRDYAKYFNKESED